MPFAIDEERFRKQNTFDVSAAPNMPNGIAVKQIPVIEFPMVVYKHPVEPYTTIEHRNTQHEVVHLEVVPTEHLSKLVHDKAGLEEAIQDGWQAEPYVPSAPPDPKASLYDAKPKAEVKAEAKPQDFKAKK